MTANKENSKDSLCAEGENGDIINDSTDTENTKHILETLTLRDTSNDESCYDPEEPPFGKLETYSERILDLRRRQSAPQKKRTLLNTPLDSRVPASLSNQGHHDIVPVRRWQSAPYRIVRLIRARSLSLKEGMRRSSLGLYVIPTDRLAALRRHSHSQRTRQRQRGIKGKFVSLCEFMIDESVVVIFFLINLLFLATGALVVEKVMLMLISSNKIVTFSTLDSSGNLNKETFMQDSAIITTAGGLIVIFVGILGVCGVRYRNVRMLRVYLMLMMTVLIVQVSGAALGYYFRYSLHTKIENKLLVALENEYVGEFNSSNDFSRSFDFAQVYFSCCGVAGAKDFKNTVWFRRVNDEAYDHGRSTWHPTFPRTCCRFKDPSPLLEGKLYDKLGEQELFDPDCQKRVPSRDNPYTGTSCLRGIQLFLTDRINAVFYTALFTIGLECFAITISATFIKEFQVQTLRQDTPGTAASIV